MNHSRPGAGRLRATSGLAALLVAASLSVLQAVPAVAEDEQSYSEFVEFVEFEGAVAADVNEFWATVFDQNDTRYPSADLVRTGAGKFSDSDCGAVSADPDEVDGASPAFYCPSDRTVYLASGWMYRDIYQKFGDFAAAVVIAHEWGHHVQNVLEIAHPMTTDDELQADCLAGAWAYDSDERGLVEQGDLDEAVAALIDAGDKEPDLPDDHGTAEERVAAFAVGFSDGNVDNCNF